MTGGFTLPGFLRDEPKRDREIRYTIRYSASIHPNFTAPNSYEDFLAILARTDFYEMPYHIMQNIENAREDVLTYA